ncbi:MAG: tetratricopeptide repeat protein [Flavobacteriales bacterium]
MVLRHLPLLLVLCSLIQACGTGAGNNANTGGEETPLTMAELDARILADPSNASLFAQRARFHEQRDSLLAAMRDWDRAIRLDSLDPRWRIAMGDLRYRKVDLPAAKSQFERAIQLDPKNTEARLKLAELLLVERDFPEAMRHANDALRIDDQNAKGYYLKGWIHQEAGDTALAISSYRTAVERDPDMYESYIALGLIHAATGDPLAMEYYNSAVEIRPTSVEAWYDRGMFAQEYGEDSVAIACYDRIKAIDPNNALAWYNTGYILLEHQERYTEARSQFTQAIVVRPTYAQAYYNRGLTYELDGKLDSAVMDYKQALALSPDMDLAALGLGRMHAKGLKVR